MAEAAGLFLADIETGDMTAFTAVDVAGSNTFAASSSAAGHGTYGARATFAGSAAQASAYRDFTARAEAYVRCYFKLSSGFNGDTGTFYVLSLRNIANSWDIRARMAVSGGAVAINRFYYRTDSAAPYASVTQNVSLDAWHYMEIRHKSATAPGANDGTDELWFDGTRIANVTGIDSDTITVDRLFVGQLGTLIPTNGSIIDIDDVKLDSSAIGEYADQEITGTVGLTQAIQSISASGSVGSGEVTGTAVLAQPPQSISGSGYQNPPGHIINHTHVAKYADIPTAYKSLVKEMWLSVPGESHSLAYRTGLELLEAADATFAVSVIDTGTPEPQTSDNLRASRASWGDLTHATGWRYEYGEEDWYTSPEAIAQTKAFLAYCASTGPSLSALGFGWCWDMTWANGGYVTGLPNDLDPVYKCHWAGSSVGGPQGNWRWGLDSADSALTGNDICLDTYLAATQEYINYCVVNDIDTTVFFTTGPVDGNAASENGYQRELKQSRIRSYVEDNGGWLFDYADILAWDDAGNHTTSSWTDGDGTAHVYDQIAPDNLGAADIGHIDAVGALRLGKALWVMLAMIAGWDGEPLTPITATSELVQQHQSLSSSGIVPIVGDSALTQAPQILLGLSSTLATGVVRLSGSYKSRSISGVEKQATMIGADA